MIKIWDLASGEIVRTLETPQLGVERLAYHPEGRRLVSAGFDGKVREWDVVTGQLLQTFDGHQSLVTDVDYSPTGGHILSASADKTWKLWPSHLSHSAQAIEYGALTHIDDNDVSLNVATVSNHLFEGQASRVFSTLNTPPLSNDAQAPDLTRFHRLIRRNNFHSAWWIAQRLLHTPDKTLRIRVEMMEPELCALATSLELEDPHHLCTGKTFEQLGRRRFE